jgi:hypothetical protein
MISEGRLPSVLARSLGQKRLVFCFSPGRSGTGFLAAALDLLPGVWSFHEPEPKFSDVMRVVQGYPSAAEQFWLDRKLPHIVSLAGLTYVETSHLFGKGFAEALLELGVSFDLIVIRRPHRDVAVSLYELRTIPGRTDLGRRFLLHPEDPGVIALARWKELSDYQLCYWYCLEMERRSSLYVQGVAKAGGRVVQTSLADMTSLGGFGGLVAKLQLPSLPVDAVPAFEGLALGRVNDKAALKAELRQPPVGNLCAQEDEVIRLVNEGEGAECDVLAANYRVMVNKRDG